mgnify:CR=1 FL=1
MVEMQIDSGTPPATRETYERLMGNGDDGYKWMRVDRPRALMEDPEGVGHVVELGTYVGRKWGKVTRIRADRIVITEEYLTPDGTLVVNPIEIGLTEAGEQEGGEAR